MKCHKTKIYWRCKIKLLRRHTAATAHGILELHPYKLLLSPCKYPITKAMYIINIGKSVCGQCRQCVIGPRAARARPQGGQARAQHRPGII